jgi:hypothetical protein
MISWHLGIFLSPLLLCLFASLPLSRNGAEVIRKPPHRKSPRVRKRLKMGEITKIERAQECASRWKQKAAKIRRLQKSAEGHENKGINEYWRVDEGLGRSERAQALRPPSITKSGYHIIYHLSIGIYAVLVSKLVLGKTAQDKNGKAHADSNRRRGATGPQRVATETRSTFIALAIRRWSIPQAPGDIHLFVYVAALLL